MYLDLLGLPPSAPVLELFLNDRRAYAYERLVNRVLPHLTSVSAGPGIGWIWPVMPTATDLRRTIRVPMPGVTGSGSSTPTIETSL